MLIGFNWCQEPDHIKEKTFQKVYLNLINQWSKTLFTPEPLLRKIINDFSHIIEYGTVVYNYKQILNIVNKINYQQYYSNFYNTISKCPNQFKIIITYLDNKNKDEYQYCLKNIQTPQYINYYFKEFSSTNNIALSFTNPTDPEYGCLIILNRNVIDKSDYNEMEYHLDHQLNHYFSTLTTQDDNIQDISFKSIPFKLKKLAYDVGFDLKDDNMCKDFAFHVLSKNEFIEMLSDTINSIKLYFNSNNKYYDWLKLINHSFIQSKQYQQLDYHLQNSIIFCYFNKVLDDYRWNIIKDHIREQLNNPKRNIIKDISNKISEIWQRYRIKRK